MKTRTVVMLIAFVMIGTGLQAQFFKKIANRAAEAAEETVLQKVDEKTTKKTGKAMDTIFDGGKQNKRKKAPKQQPQREEDIAERSPQNNKRTVKSAKDFVPGNKVLYSDTFSNDAIGDFPVTWNTNASAEVVMFEGDDTRWLQMDNKGFFIPESITNIPVNSTLEFDLYTPEEYDHYSQGFCLNLMETSDKSNVFNKSKNRVELWFHPSTAEVGSTNFYNVLDGAIVVKNQKGVSDFSHTKNLVHVSIWRQNSRMRVYLDDNKIWDLPRVFSDSNYNTVVFQTAGVRRGVNARFYIANVRLAVAGEDTRHALLETGRFETNEILFDVGKATIQASSFTILDELGQLLEENKDFNLNIIGHTDADGAAETNQELSEDRAQSVKAYLTDNFAIKGNRLQTAGRGASVPVATNETEAGKQQNRRVEFVKM